MQLKQSHRQPQLHGHRGARGIYPENTLPGFSYAMAVGVDAIELDIVCCADEIVVYHNLQLNPATTRQKNGAWVQQRLALKNIPFAQLYQLDIGRINPTTDYARQFPRQCAIDDTHIPRLFDVIDTVKLSDNNALILNIELKSDPEQPALTPTTDQYIDHFLTVVQRYRMNQRLFVQSFDWRLVRLLKQRAADIKTGCLSDCQPGVYPQTPQPTQATDWTDGFDLTDYNGSIPRMVAATGCDVWSSHYPDLSADAIKQAHQLGLEVNAWTVNQIAELENLIDWQVDSITSDYPQLMRGLIDQNKPDY